MSRGNTDIINAVWRLVIEQGYRREEAAARLGITETRIDWILNALHSRRRRLEKHPQPRTGEVHAIILEDDFFAAEMVEHMLASSHINAKVTHASCKEQFIHALSCESVDIVISDSSLVDIKPLRAFQLAKQRHPGVEFFILSARKDPARAAIAHRAGVAAFIEKERAIELMSAVRDALAQR